MASQERTCTRPHRGARHDVSTSLDREEGGDDELTNEVARRARDHRLRPRARTHGGARGSRPAWAKKNQTIGLTVVGLGLLSLGKQFGRPGAIWATRLSEWRRTLSMGLCMFLLETIWDYYMLLFQHSASNYSPSMMELGTASPARRAHHMAARSLISSGLPDGG